MYNLIKESILRVSFSPIPPVDSVDKVVSLLLISTSDEIASVVLARTIFAFSLKNSSLYFAVCMIQFTCITSTTNRAMEEMKIKMVVRFSFIGVHQNYALLQACNWY